MAEAPQNQEAQQGHEETPESVWMHGSQWQPTAMWGVTWLIMVILLSLGLLKKKRLP